MVSKVYIISFLNELAAGLRETTRKTRTKKIVNCKVKAEKTCLLYTSPSPRD